MESAISLALKRGAEFVEASSAKASRNIVEAVDKKIKELSSGSKELNSVRVLFNGRWGLAYSYEKDFKFLALEALKNAKSSDFSVKLNLRKPIKRRFTTAFKKNPDDYSLEEKKNEILKLSKKPNNISNLRIVYSDSKLNNKYMNSEGSNLEWNDTSSGIMSWAFAERKQEGANFVEIERIKGGFEILNKAQSCVDNSINKALMMLNADKPKSCVTNVVIDSRLGGALAHEAIGHACEADLVMSNASLLHGKIGKRIGNELVSITDNGLLKEWGYTPFDSEGNLARRNVLVKKGILQSYMHNRETAALTNSKPTGNGRSMNLASKVIVRMTNTYFENGDSNFDELINEAKNGYYLKGSAGGQGDTASGEFLFNAMEGYEIKNGQIGKMVKSASLTGNITQTLHNLKLVAKDLSYGTGFCGKSGQTVPVGDGAPHILIANSRVGGE